MIALSTLFPLGLRATSRHATTPLDLATLLPADAWARLPQAVRRRFGAAHIDTTYAGQMDLRCSRVGRLYAWLARPLRGPLTSINAQAVASSVRVYSNSRGGVVWERRFHTGCGLTERGAPLVRSTKEIGPGHGLLERTDGGLSMSLDVFEEDGALVFRSNRFWFIWGGLRLPIPSWLAPGVCTVTHTDLGFGLFRYTLSMVHPLWGETFSQSGVFADPCGSAS